MTITLTGRGSFALEFERHFPCEIFSLRNSSPEQIDGRIEKSDVIIHNAANLAPVGLRDAVNDNFMLTKLLVDRVGDLKPNVVFLYISSMSVLASEDVYQDVGKMSLYTISKYMAEIYCLRRKLKNLKIVRFSTLFYEQAGKDGLSDIIAEAVDRKVISLLGTGSARRDFVPLEVGTRYVYSIATRGLKNVIYNIATGRSISFAEVAELLKKRVYGLRVNYQDAPTLLDVLFTFSVDSLKELGEIDFKIEECIARFAAARMK